MKHVLQTIGPVVIFVIIVLTASAHARPEYATKEKLNCVACHTSPWGGGPRTVLGKTYGSRDLGVGKLSTTDVVYGDARMISYWSTKRTSQRTHGLALMQASITGNVPIVQPENGSELRGVLTYNMAPLSGATAREAYVRYQPPGSKPERPIHIIAGQFYMPFGLLTDEHRTYTRMQTNMTLNNYNVGAALTGNATNDLHYDLAIVNDFQSAGNFVTNNLTWGSVLNVRWNPQALPFLVCASGNFEHLTNERRPFAASVYGALSIDRLTEGKISGSLLLERVDAFRWNNPVVNTGQVNPALLDFFIPPSDTDYRNAVTRTPSVGYYAQAKYNLTSRHTLMYKFDYLALRKNRPGDAFMRHGFGIESFLMSNVILQARVELASTVDSPATAGGDSLGAQDDAYLMLRFWL